MKKFIVPIVAIIFAVTCLFGCGEKQGDTSSIQPIPTESVDDMAKVLDNLFDKGTEGLVQMLGEPNEKSEPTTEENDGWSHQIWTYSDNGLSVNLVDRGSGYVVCRATATKGCTWSTQKGISIGDNEEKIRSVYGDLVNEDYTFPEMGNIVVGQPSNCILFHLENDAVASITVGEMG